MSTRGGRWRRYGTAFLRLSRQPQIDTALGRTVRDLNVSGKRRRDGRMGAGLPLFDRRLLIVTGKGGVGKSAVAMAAALAAATHSRRTLLVDLAGDGSLGERLGVRGALGAEPCRVRPNLAAVRLDPREALEDFLHGLLRFRALTNRLLGSTSFRIVTAAAPGIDEFLALYRIERWEAERRRGFHGRRYDLVVVDAPATGHALPLLAAPETFLRMVGVGPLADLATRLRALLADPTRTLVAVVTIPEEMAVTETIELYRTIGQQLGLPLAPPLVNAVPPRRFSRAEEALLGNGCLDRPDWRPYAGAARFEIARRRSAEAHIRRLRAALAITPLRLPFLFTRDLALADVGRLADALAAAAGARRSHGDDET
jgi:anion-transporting  ArsA/GET3 family ATPase